MEQQLRSSKHLLHMCAGDARGCLVQELPDAERREAAADAGQRRQPRAAHDIRQPHIALQVCCLLAVFLLCQAGRRRSSLVK